MRQLDLYEFAAIVVPGTILLTALYVVYPAAKELLGQDGLSIGEAGLGIVLAYGVGHILQALGNMLEALWWKALGGMPTDWAGENRRNIINADQFEALKVALARAFPDRAAPLGTAAKPQGWKRMVREVYAKVAAAGRAGRVDIFNANYGLCRGLATAMLVALALSIIKTGLCHWELKSFLLVGVGLSWFRMHRFARHYARELIVQFIDLQSSQSKDVA